MLTTPWLKVFIDLWQHRERMKLKLIGARQWQIIALYLVTVMISRAQLEALQVGPRAEEIAAAQAALDAANARRARLSEGGRAVEVAAGRAALEASQAALQRLNDGPDQNARISAAADVANTLAALRSAQAAYDKIKDQPDHGM